MRPLSSEQGPAPRMTFRLTPTDLDRLDEIARRRGLPRAAALREAIAVLDSLDQHGEAVPA